MQKNFISWNKTELAQLLGIFPAKECGYLDEWLASKDKHGISDFEEQFLEWLFQYKVPYIDNWNEAELRDQLISHITSIINFISQEYIIGVFAERTMGTILNGIEVRGKIDWMVATGIDSPSEPYFFIHEYKQEEGGNTTVSGRAQLYAIMRTAQELNGDYKTPIYGCYVLGRFWFFTSLVNNRYCISDVYDSSQKDDLFDIVKILKAQKEIILDRVRQQSKMKI